MVRAAVGPWSVMLYLALVGVVSAEPCAARLDALQMRAIVLLEGNAAQGRSARESTSATMHRQPTPRSMAEAEVQLGELPAEKVDAFRSAFLRARKAAESGDEPACQRAVDAAEQLLKEP